MMRLFRKPKHHSMGGHEPQAKVGYFPGLVLVNVGDRHYALSSDEFSDIRSEAIGWEASKEYFLAPLPSNPKHRRTHEAAKLALEEKTVAAVGRRSDWGRNAIPLVEFGRWTFARDGNPRSSTDLILGWRIAEAAIENSWRRFGTTTFCHATSPFSGVMVMAPEPLGPFFLPDDGLKQIVVAETAMRFDYSDRTVRVEFAALRVVTR